MDFTSKKGHLSLELNARKNIYYYLCYLIVFFMVHLATYSTVSFFHFLLDHDMSTIENWISRNNWEVLIFAKLIALAVCLKFLNLNQYQDLKFGELLKKNFSYPSMKIVLTSIFLLGVSYILSLEFYDPSTLKLDKEQFLGSAFLGIILFFVVDAVYLYILNEVYSVKRSSRRALICVLTLLFAVFTKLSIPYLGNYLVIAILHFVSLYLIGMRHRLGDAILYCLVIIAPMNTFMKVDLLSGWEQNYQALFFVGLLGTWVIGLGYYRISRLN